MMTVSVVGAVRVGADVLVMGGDSEHAVLVVRAAISAFGGIYNCDIAELRRLLLEVLERGHGAAAFGTTKTGAREVHVIVKRRRAVSVNSPVNFDVGLFRNPGHIAGKVSSSDVY